VRVVLCRCVVRVTPHSSSDTAMPFFAVFNPLTLSADATRNADDTPPGSPARNLSSRADYHDGYPPIVRQLAALWMYKANIRGAQDARQAIIRRQLGALKEGLLAQEIPLATVNRIKHKVVGSNGISYVARSHHSVMQAAWERVRKVGALDTNAGPPEGRKLRAGCGETCGGVPVDWGWRRGRDACGTFTRLHDTYRHVGLLPAAVAVGRAVVTGQGGITWLGELERFPRSVWHGTHPTCLTYPHVSL
jgi:hypothetical protein